MLRRRLFDVWIVFLVVLTLGVVSSACDGSGGQNSTDIAKRPPRHLKPGSITSILYLEDGDGVQNRATLYLPSPARPKTPVVILIHGGGWKVGVDARVLDNAARDLQSDGVAVWNVEYRRVGNGGGWATTFSDVAGAVDFVADLRRRAPDLALDNVVVAGHSAGGQLAVWAAARAIRPSEGPGPRPRVFPRLAVSLAGSLDMRLSAARSGNARDVLGGMPDEVPDRYRRVDPMQRINPRVPVVIVHSTDDQVVPFSVANAYQRADADGRVLVVPLLSGGHAGPIVGAGWQQSRRVILAATYGGFEAAFRLQTTAPA